MDRAHGYCVAGVLESRWRAGCEPIKRWGGESSGCYTQENHYMSDQGVGASGGLFVRWKKDCVRRTNGRVWSQNLGFQDRETAIHRRAQSIGFELDIDVGLAVKPPLDIISLQFGLDVGWKEAYIRVVRWLD